MNTVLIVKATIGFSENLFLVKLVVMTPLYRNKATLDMCPSLQAPSITWMGRGHLKTSPLILTPWHVLKQRCKHVLKLYM